jgi:hypothetical protein
MMLFAILCYGCIKEYTTIERDPVWKSPTQSVALRLPLRRTDVRAREGGRITTYGSTRFIHPEPVDTVATAPQGLRIADPLKYHPLRISSSIFVSRVAS